MNGLFLNAPQRGLADKAAAAGLTYPEQFLAHMAIEHSPQTVLLIQTQDLLGLVGLVQTALTHPKMTPYGRDVGRRFIAQARRKLAPELRRVIELGERAKTHGDITK